MAYTTIDDPGLYFNIVLWSGDGTTPRTISGVGFQPDWVWLKHRSGSGSRDHYLSDVARGATKSLNSNTSDAEVTSESNGHTSAFTSDGFTVVNGGNSVGEVNDSSRTYTGWCWKAGGSTSSNSDGDITSSVSANQTAGFSIVTYTATSTATDTVGHGLGAKPGLIIVKERDGTNQWCVAFPDTLNNNQILQLNLTNQVFADSAAFNDTVNTGTTSSVFVTGNGGLTGNNGSDYVAYCAAPIQGYTRMGTYTGNGNADGPFIYTGFRPKYLLIKISSGSNRNWAVFDAVRSTANALTFNSLPNKSDVDDSGTNEQFDFCATGFKVRGSFTTLNESGSTYVFYAIAESPFVNSKGVPNNAR